MILLSKVSRTLDIKGRFIFPGKNPVDKETQTFLEANTMVKHFIKKGDLRFVPDGTTIPKALDVDFGAKLKMSAEKKAAAADVDLSEIGEVK